MRVRAIFVGLCLAVTFAACGDDDDLVVGSETTDSGLLLEPSTAAPVDPDFEELDDETVVVEEPTVIEGFELDPIDCSDWTAGTPEEAICQTFSRWVRIDTADEDRVRMFEDGEANADGIIDGFAQFYDSIKFATAEVLEITLIDEQSADVEFQLRWMDGPSPIFPDPRTGTAVLVDGTWRVSTATSCELALSFGADCAGGTPASPGGEVTETTAVAAVPIGGY